MEMLKTVKEAWGVKEQCEDHLLSQLFNSPGFFYGL